MVVDVLGSGGFGKVLLAIDELANHEVAIKSYRDENYTESSIIRELQFLASLKHNSIVTFYHHFIHNSMLHIVMEYCSGGSLADLLSERKYEIDEALTVGIKIAETLIFIHSKGIIHRDIKPGNILFDENDNPKLSDFGVSNTRGGTFSYLPPEIYYSDYIHSLDPKIDVYSLGILLIEMLTGENPFVEIPKEEILSAKLNHTFIPDILPHWLQEIILKATNPSPELRFQTAKEFSAALKSRSVPFVVNKVNIKADKLFAYAEKYLAQKKWLKSFSYIKRGIEISKDSALGNITAGKYHLKTQNLILAKKYFEKAFNINPGVNIKKELSAIHLDEGNYPQAISLLQNHIQLNPIDWEAYNLLAECYYRMNRFELALDIFETIFSDINLDCFWNNWLITHLCNGSSSRSIISKAKSKSVQDHFIEFNISIYRDDSKSWSATSDMKNKFLYHSFRFHKYDNSNNIIIELNNNNQTFSKPLISIGRNEENDFVINNTSVSRRHCAIVNYDKDIWLYDLGSFSGVFVDGQKISNKCLLLGKHKIDIGTCSFNLYTSDDVLL